MKGKQHQTTVTLFQLCSFYLSIPYQLLPPSPFFQYSLIRGTYTRCYSPFEQIRSIITPLDDLYRVRC